MDNYYNTDLEAGLLGMLMLNNKDYDSVEGRLKPEDFYVPLFSRCYELIGESIAEGIEANPLTLKARLLGKWGDKELDGYFETMVKNAIGCKDITSLAASVVKEKNRREIDALAKQLAYANERGDEELSDAARNALASVSSSFQVRDVLTPQEQFKNAYKAASEGVAMMDTNIRCWDDIFGGIFAGSRYAIAGQGGAGKSALAVNIAWNMACNGKKVRYLAFEETENAVWNRIAARVSGVPIGAFRSRDGLSDEAKEKIIKSQECIFDKDFKVHYRLPNVESMITECGQCDLIVLDGVSSAPVPEGVTVVERAGVVSNYAIKLAEKTGAAVILLYHMNSEGLKNKSSTGGIFGGQVASFDPEGMVEIRRVNPEADGYEIDIVGNVIKNRYGVMYKKLNLIFNGKYQTYKDA